MTAAPRILTVAGFDPSGRAGLLADVWAIDRAGGSAVGAVSALTSQAPGKFWSQPAGARALRLQLQGVGAVAAVKLGMIPDRATLRQVVRSLAGGGLPIVIDPVVRSSRGERLSGLEARDYLRLGAQLGGRHWLVLTPNREELGWLGGDPAVLLAAGFSAVIVKGSQTAIDVVFSRKATTRLRGSPLLRTSTHRGTGCRFASALATRLGWGDDLVTAARFAKRQVRNYLSRPIMMGRFT